MRVTKGSAMLIALFVMATLGMLSMLSSRIFVSEANVSSNLSASNSAYYIAEGALEKSLLDYRLNADVQLSDEYDSVSHSQVLPDEEMEDISSDLKLTNDQTRKAFSRISFLDKEYKCHSEEENCGELPKDETVQFMVPSKVKTITLHWSAYGNDCDEPDKCKLRVTLISDNNLNDLDYLHDSGEIVSLLPSVSEYTYTIPSTSSPKYFIVRFRPLNTGLKDYWLSYQGEDDLLIDSGQTRIDALGQVAGVSRQLQVVIDRSRNGLSPLFDYTIFAYDEEDGSITD